MAEVIWLDTATARLEEIASYITQFDERAADRFQLRLKRAGDSLAIFPERGRLAARGRRELVSVRPYIITYRVLADTVFILTIRHGRQRRLR